VTSENGFLHTLQATTAQNVVHNNLRSGILFAGSRCILANNVFDANGESTVFMNGSAEFSFVIGNEIRRATRTNISAHGIECAGSSITISNNIIDDVDACGITVTDGLDISIANNRISNYRQDTDYYNIDWSAAGISIISSSGYSSRNISVINNTVRKGASGEYGIIVYNQAGASAAPVGLRIQDNDLKDAGITGAIYYRDSSGLGVFGDDCIVKDNIGHESSAPAIGVFQASATTGTYSVTGIPFPPSAIELSIEHFAGTEQRRCRGVASRKAVARVQWSAMDGASGTTTGANEGANRIIKIASAAGSTLLEATLSSFDPAGFTINKSTASINPVIQFVAYP
jgi:hypothetical protein